MTDPGRSLTDLSLSDNKAEPPTLDEIICAPTPFILTATRTPFCQLLSKPVNDCHELVGVRPR